MKKHDVVSSSFELFSFQKVKLPLWELCGSKFCRDVLLPILETLAPTTQSPMAICKTPGCGCPGRPFPNCALCQRYEYCGSHCLGTVRSDLSVELVQDGGDISVVELKEGDRICPPCLERIRQRPVVEEREELSVGGGNEGVSA
jgi:hypothetical protein